MLSIYDVVQWRMKVAFLWGTTNFTRSLLILRKITFLGKYKNSLSPQSVENWMGVEEFS